MSSVCLTIIFCCTHIDNPMCLTNCPTSFRCYFLSFFVTDVRFANFSFFFNMGRHMNNLSPAGWDDLAFSDIIASYFLRASVDLFIPLCVDGTS